MLRTYLPMVTAVLSQRLVCWCPGSLSSADWGRVRLQPRLCSLACPAQPTALEAASWRSAWAGRGRGGRGDLSVLSSGVSGGATVDAGLGKHGYDDENVTAISRPTLRWPATSHQHCAVCHLSSPGLPPPPAQLLWRITIFRLNTLHFQINSP